MKKFRKELLKDVLYILIGAIIAIILSQLGFIDALIGLVQIQTLAIFLGGLLFTSALTISPATVILAHLSLQSPIWQVALFGSIGAVVGDILLFIFLRDKVFRDIEKSIRPSILHKFTKSFHFGFLRWLIPLTGALIIASPLPDELGLAMLGMSRSNSRFVITISLIMNFIGIYCIASVARTFL